jgi:hypothetical protein
VKRNEGSPLLRLPPELRYLIWKYVLGGQTLQFRFVKKKSSNMEGMVPPISERANGLDLLRVCRQVYAETALVPYTANIFAFYSWSYIKYDLIRLKNFQRREIMDIQLEVYSPSGLFAAQDMSEAEATKSRQLLATQLPALKRIHIIIFKPSQGSGQVGSWDSFVDTATKNTREQLDILFAEKDLTITFEAIKYSQVQYRAR